MWFKSSCMEANHNCSLSYQPLGKGHAQLQLVKSNKLGDLQVPQGLYYKNAKKFCPKALRRLGFDSRLPSPPANISSYLTGQNGVRLHAPDLSTVAGTKPPSHLIAPCPTGCWESTKVTSGNGILKMKMWPSLGILVISVWWIYLQHNVNFLRRQDKKKTSYTVWSQYLQCVFMWVLPCMERNRLKC